LDQHLSRNPQFAVQLADHIQRKWPGASHDFIDPSSLPNDPYQRPIILALLLKTKFNGINGIGQINGMVLAFVRLN
jgi:hypothetical protein